MKPSGRVRIDKNVPKSISNSMYSVLALKCSVCDLLHYKQTLGFGHVLGSGSILDELSNLSLSRVLTKTSQEIAKVNRGDSTVALLIV